MTIGEYMNKLKIMSKLASVYHTLPTENDNDDHSAKMHVEDRFNYFRRSLRIADLKPQPSTEGLNPKGPTFF